MHGLLQLFLHSFNVLGSDDKVVVGGVADLFDEANVVVVSKLKKKKKKKKKGN